MATSRRCGYCREQGHRVTDCGLRVEHRNTFLTHTPRERKSLLEFMARQGFGYGAVVILGGYYGSMGGGVKTAILTDSAWIKELQFTGFKHKKYSKQVIISAHSAYDRTIDGKPRPEQYRSFNVTALITADGHTGESIFQFATSDLVNVIDKPNPDRGYSTALIQPSYTPFEVSPSDLTDNLVMPQRLFVEGEATASRWDKYGYVKGILPT